MQRRGSVWLPVRRPAAYAGEVMRGLGGAAGLTLPAAEVVRTAPDGGVLALRASDPLVQILREMLLYSTNLTAETVGLRASQARGLSPDGLAPSASAMTRWARGRFGIRGARFVNHSGLSDASEISPAELVAVLRRAEGLGLPGLLKPRPILDARKQPVAAGVAVMSKTGTMDFVSGLAGYVTGRRRMAFAILASDPGLRARIRPDQRDDPPGNRAWVARAKAQEQALLRRWAATICRVRVSRACGRPLQASVGRRRWRAALPRSMAAACSRSMSSSCRSSSRNCSSAWKACPSAAATSQQSA